EQAAQYLQSEFIKTGLEVKEDPFEWEKGCYRNIMAEKKGEISPNKVFILGAHYDTVPGSPGADDNASGIAVLLEIARMIHPFSTNSTVRLIAFSLEESGFVGSTHCVKKMSQIKERILGMISLEMVGFTDPVQNYPSSFEQKFYPTMGDFIGLIGNERSKSLLEKVRQSFKTHIPQLPLEFLIVSGNGEGIEEVRLSDHSIFWDHGFPALMITDTSFLRNPHYHLPSDTMETLDFEFMSKVTVGIFYSILELTK
ncbi:MAG: hypothetical protein A2169_09025, partial [Deltaproteobacteria bacterium RBG_13_47_9]